jgi:acetyl-CoA carboxylase biotin carboxyl carrier protein
VTHGELASRATTSHGPATTEDPAQTLSQDVVQLAQTLPGDLRRLSVRRGDTAIEVEWAFDDRAAPEGSGALRAVAGTGTVSDVPPTGTDVPADVTAVRAPLVGTFYASPSPDADPFVQVGDDVEAGQTLAIVEAMKLMNPIVADGAGVVVEVLVGDAESVEYGQVLMHLRLAGGPR